MNQAHSGSTCYSRHLAHFMRAARAARQLVAARWAHYSEASPPGVPRMVNCKGDAEAGI